MGASSQPSADLKSLPIDADALGERHQLVDLAYGAVETELVRAARARGARVVDGLEVLVRQGAASLGIWTGLEPPIEVMRRAARRTDGNRITTRIPETGPLRGRGVGAAAEEVSAGRYTGLTPPLQHSHSGMFVTDVIVELGYASRERVDDVMNEARRGLLAPESLLATTR